MSYLIFGELPSFTTLW